MADLQFDDQSNEFGAPPTASAGGSFADKMVNWGLASNAQQAEYVLIGAVVAILIIAFFVFSGSSDSVPPPPPVGV